jgi:hypothetical protein
MPHTVHKRGGKKPYAIVNKTTGKVVGRSTSRVKAKQSAALRDRAHPGS